MGEFRASYDQWLQEGEPMPSYAVPNPNQDEKEVAAEREWSFLSADLVRAARNDFEVNHKPGLKIREGLKTTEVISLTTEEPDLVNHARYEANR